MTMFWWNSHYSGVITKQFFLICQKFESQVASQSWKHCICMNNSQITSHRLELSPLGQSIAMSSHKYLFTGFVMGCVE